MKMQKSVISVKKNLKINISKIKNIGKLEITVFIQENIHIVSHNGSNYDYHFLIKELAKDFRKTIYLFRRNY